MRTTIQLDDNLHELAKQYAVANGKTFTAVVEDALREKLIARTKSCEKTPVKLKTVAGKGVHRGVDLDDSAALLEIMDTE